jgi:hypothetical protein
VSQNWDFQLRVAKFSSRDSARCTADFPRVFEVVDFISSTKSLRPGTSALLDGKNLDLMVARQDNIARGFSD